MTAKKHKIINVVHHSDEPDFRFGKWTAGCQCGRWSGMGADEKKLHKAFKEHLDFVKKEK